jgi:hypothetical protein
MDYTISPYRIHVIGRDYIGLVQQHMTQLQCIDMPHWLLALNRIGHDILRSHISK